MCDTNKNKESLKKFSQKMTEMGKEKVAFKWLHILLVLQTAGCNSPHDWLMSLAMDLTVLCDMWR